MIKKIIAVALAAAFCAPAANAWDQICMKLPLWRTWFAGHFHIVHDFKPENGLLPYGVHLPGRTQQFKWTISTASEEPARGRIDSPAIAVNQSRCADITAIPEGQAFFVYFQPLAGPAALCKPNPANTEKYYLQRKDSKRKMWHESSGSAPDPRCKYTHESN